VLVLLGLSAALLLAVGFVLQQHEAAEIPAGGFRPGLLLVLARRPVWLGGIAAMVGGQVLGATALGTGSLVVVEPLLATNVLFALPLAAMASRRWLSRGDWVGAIVVIGGLALFLVGIAPRSAVETERLVPWLAVVIGVAFTGTVALLLLFGRGRGARTRAALTAGAAGVLFGLQDFITQRSVLRLDHGVLALLTSTPPWILLAVAVTGLTLAQRAFGLADLSASLPPITLAEPVAGIALSMAVGQELPRRLPLLAAALGGLALMLAGVVLLTRSPLVVDPHGRRHRIHLPHPHVPHPHVPHPHLPHRSRDGRGAPPGPPLLGHDAEAARRDRDETPGAA
jgi:drug/metabolite transporter (DMT)-like permease